MLEIKLTLKRNSSDSWSDETQSFVLLYDWFGEMTA